MPDRPKRDVEDLLEALGVSQISDEVFDILATHSPTIKAFIAGEINFQQALFIEAYLSNGFNAEKAAKSAKVAALRTGAYVHIGATYLQQPCIKTVIAKRLAQKVLAADDVLAEWGDVAKADMSDFVTIREMAHPITGAAITVAEPDLAKAAEMGKLHLVKKIKLDDKGGFQMELRDPDKALDQIARHLGMFEKDNVLSVPKGLLELLNAPPEQRRQKLEEYKALASEEDG